MYKRKAQPPPVWINDDMGPVKAFEVLGGLRSEDNAANAVLDLYRAIDQNPLPEAGMLWLLRTPEDTAEGYIWSLGLSKDNREFVLDCYNREYRKPKEVPDDDGDND